MRGMDRRTEGLFSYVSCESRAPPEHPLRAILPVADEALARLSPDLQRFYALNGRPSIAPEKLLRALLLQALFSVRSERQLMEQLDYNLLFRWFVGLDVGDPVWDVIVFIKNRDRLLASEIAAKFLRAVLAQPKVRALLSAEPFSVDGALIQAWAGMKSSRPKDGSGELPAPGCNDERDFHGERGPNIAARADAGPGGVTRAEAMIARAEAACARYLQAANEPGLGTLALRKRRDNWRAMMRVLARLRDQSTNFSR